MNKICLINPPTTGHTSKDIYFPMALVCLASALKDNNIPVEIVDFDLELKQNSSLQNWDSFLAYAIERLQEVGCDLFGISSICSNYPIALLLAQDIKRNWPSCRVILGGPQPSSVPEETLKFCPSLDAIVIGEGESTLLDLAKCDWKKESLEKIPGIAFLDGDKTTKTTGRTLIDKLDELPYPDFSLLPLTEYLAIDPGIALIEAGRGCPFLCSFCSTSLMWERKFRVKTPARILKEMNLLLNNYGIRNFGLTHDNFTTSHSYVEEFSRYFEEHNVEGFAWSSSARPDTVNIERIEALYRAGCRGLFFGVDTGSDRIQKTIKKHLSLSHFRQVLSKAVSLGIEVISSFILGFNEETEDDINQTIRLALEARLAGTTSVQLHRLAPLAGTTVLEENQSNLSLYSGPSDVSILPIRDRGIDALIEQDARLFSSFYSIETPHLAGVNVSALAVYYSALINHASPALSQLLQVTECTPIELFQHWMNWREEQYPQSAIEETLILNTLGQFLADRGFGIASNKRSLSTSIAVHRTELHS